MNDNSGRPRRRTLVWPAAAYTAVVLGAGVVTAGWFRPAADEGWQMLVAAAVFAVAAVLGFVWLVRARAARRLQAVMDAYADREIARAGRRQALKRRMPFVTRRGVLTPGRRS
jgi:Flp pilus assembly protein TadB